MVETVEASDERGPGGEGGGVAGREPGAQVAKQQVLEKSAELSKSENSFGPFFYLKQRLELPARKPSGHSKRKKRIYLQKIETVRKKQKLRIPSAVKLLVLKLAALWTSGHNQNIVFKIFCCIRLCLFCFTQFPGQ